MNIAKNVSFIAMMALALAFTACQEDVETLGRNDKAMTKHPGGPGNKATPLGELGTPKVIARTYIPRYDHFANELCRTWRIEWPTYEAGVDPARIPSLFASGNGTLSSINHLSGATAEDKAGLDFSLYYDNMLKIPFSVGEIWPISGGYTAEVPYFVKYDLPLSTIIHWVTERPSQFENYWDRIEGESDEVSYQEGDFFLMWLSESNRYGGIRIVSENPRIIEVYIAEPNL